MDLFFAAPLGLGPTELLIILGIVLLLFGGSKLPSLAKGLGQSVKEFKKASKDGAAEEDEKIEKTSTTAAVEPKKLEAVKRHGDN